MNNRICRWTVTSACALTMTAVASCVEPEFEDRNGEPGELDELDEPGEFGELDELDERFATGSAETPTTGDFPELDSFQRIDELAPESVEPLDSSATELASARDPSAAQSRTYRTSVTRCFFNCPSSQDLLAKARRLCKNAGWLSAWVTWVSPCHGVSGRPTCRRRWVDFKCWTP